ncbi:unnamed protein product [Lactuca saligna]|uniref:Translation elongation factor EFTu-like domain-containing protein n=1 Tax=Lactuca saligna TaxID=75948 RepID=A0AA35ZDF2_LACSI|nr:unnamed protein product [Lactuca saligna]
MRSTIHTLFEYSVLNFEHNLCFLGQNSGEGIPEMLLLLVQWAQKTMTEKLTYSSDIQCTVLEIKVIKDLGTTIYVVLVNGVLHEGDEIVVCGFQELRVKGAYIHHKEIKVAQGIKKTAQVMLVCKLFLQLDS